MGIGPVPATRLALEKAGLKLSDIDLIEVKKPSPRNTSPLSRNSDLIANGPTSTAALLRWDIRWARLERVWS